MQSDRWTELSPEECAALLNSRRVGRVGFLDGEWPVILPVNFVVDGGCVVFRTGAGSKLDAAAVNASIAFEIDGIDPANRTGWSVLVRGNAELITDSHESQRLGALPLVAWAPGAKSKYVRIIPVATTGRRISVPTLPSNYWG